MHEFESRDHRRLCTIEMIAEGHGERCPGEDCAFWSRGCVLERVESEIESRPEVASLLLELRREIEAGRKVSVAEVAAKLEAVTPSEEAGPAGGATELV
ncbi:MAG: hypothetical protein U0R50_08245 [Gaiellales bacterium]